MHRQDGLSAKRPQERSESGHCDLCRCGWPGDMGHGVMRHSAA